MTTLIKNRIVSETSIVAQTYALLGLGLVLATFCAVASLTTVFSFWESIGMFVASLALMFGAMVFRENTLGLICYFGFISVMGYITGPAINHYLQMPNGSNIVMQALGATAVTTFALSAYAFISGRSFNQLGGFLFAGLIIVIFASLANIFIGSSIFDLVIASVSALIFSGYILFDTSKILSGEIDSPVHGAISLFLDVANLFLSLLRIFGYFGSDD